MNGANVFYIEKFSEKEAKIERYKEEKRNTTLKKTLFFRINAIFCQWNFFLKFYREREKEKSIFCHPLKPYSILKISSLSLKEKGAEFDTRATEERGRERENKRERGGD